MENVTISDVVGAVTYPEEEVKIVRFIRDEVGNANSDGVVVGVSGGIDSAVTLRLAVNALGEGRVTAIVMPSVTTPKVDTVDAISLLKGSRVTLHTIDIGNILRSYVQEISTSQRIALGNLKARIRMSILYYYANLHNLLVLGTGDRSEIMLGYFTKYGDGGVDLLPLANLYKTQVRELAKRLSIPKRIIDKPSSPQLWGGQTAEKELGASYKEIDKVLYAMNSFPRTYNLSDLVRMTKVSEEVIENVLNRYSNTYHKRHMPRSPPW